MTYTETHKVTLTKEAQRHLREKVIESNLASLLASVNTKSLRVRGWTIESDPVSMTGMRSLIFRERANLDTYEYELPVAVTFTSEAGKHPDKLDLSGILRQIWQRAGAQAFGRWTLSAVDGQPYTPPDEGEVPTPGDMVGYAEVELPDDWEGNFDHLFGLDAHISRIKTALEAGMMSGWTNRYHCALVGPPGCGKSDICRTIKTVLGEDAVMEFDATATTAAGAIKELAEREILPRVLLVEEIEKADEKALSFLLGLCDLRGEIRKTTARATLQRDTKVFVIATVNDVALFDRLAAGALSSRFSNKIWFKRPSREMLALILAREIAKIDGDDRWISPALDYCDSQGITDPRMVLAICLCGREKLLTGEYQRMMADTSDPTETLEI